MEIPQERNIVVNQAQMIVLQQDAEDLTNNLLIKEMEAVRFFSKISFFLSLILNYEKNIIDSFSICFWM